MQRLHRLRRASVTPVGTANCADGSRQSFWGVDRIGDYYGQPYTHPLAGVETVEQVEAMPGPRPTG